MSVVPGANGAATPNTVSGRPSSEGLPPRIASLTSPPGTVPNGAPACTALPRVALHPCTFTESGGIHIVSDSRRFMSSSPAPSEFPASTMSWRQPLPVFRLYSPDCGTLSYPSRDSSSLSERTSSPRSPTLRSR